MVFSAPRTLAQQLLDQVKENAHFIGGEEWRAHRRPQSGHRRAAETNAARHRRRHRGAVEAASRAFPKWRDTSPTTRANLLRRWGDLCTEHAEDIASLEAIEVGKIYQGPANLGERAIDYAGLADKLTGDTLPSANPNVLGITLASHTASAAASCRGTERPAC